MKDLVLVMFFDVSLAVFILIDSTIVFANCVRGKVDLLIFHLQNVHSQDVNNLTRADTGDTCHVSGADTCIVHTVLNIVNSQRTGSPLRMYVKKSISGRIFKKGAVI